MDSLMIDDTKAVEPREPKSKNTSKKKSRKLRIKPRSASTQQNRLSPSLKCPKKNCGVWRNTRKEINCHYVKKNTKNFVCVMCATKILYTTQFTTA